MSNKPNPKARMARFKELVVGDGTSPKRLEDEKSKAGPDLMAKSPIPVTEGVIDGVGCQIVDGRTLHQKMGVARDFTNWIKARIEKYGFVEGEDYLLAKFGEQLPSGTKYSASYQLSLNMAKELAMVENNELGRAARRYFLQCEKQLLAQTQERLTRIGPSVNEHAEYTFDLNGKKYENDVDVKHAFGLVLLLNKKPRRSACKEYARVLSILGEDSSIQAMKLSDDTFAKTFNADVEKLKRKIDEDDDFNVFDLREVRKVLLEGGD